MSVVLQAARALLFALALAAFVGFWLFLEFPRDLG